MSRLGDRPPLFDQYEWIGRWPLDGFIVVRRWSAIRGATALRLPSSIAEYAGLHRAPVEPCSDLQQARARLSSIRLFELRAAQLGSASAVGSEGCFPWISDERDALDVMRWANTEEPASHEVVWARLETPRSAATPPEGARCLGYELSQMTYAYSSVVAAAVLGLRVHDDGQVEPCCDDSPLRAWSAKLTRHGLLPSTDEGERLFEAMQLLGGGEPDDSYAIRSMWRLPAED